MDIEELLKEGQSTISHRELNSPESIHTKG